ncbi:nicotinate phosphoribosyltransferase [Massilia horti]|uniref:Nicotinate phosphoribosyltransferase n=1 Tax=Massilia horti TaxID=2562153 RepID=A0A4Y9T2M9_9BURK|nr:nicotinate phosphoribosyltransferase [Massilia horti]TFW31300.1 nicotinate phosphoribosyltransferase [Massilia horti]
MDTAASVLLTDLYELTMLQSYYRSGMNEPAVFEFFVRSLPQSRNFLVAAGLEQVLEYLQTLAFSPEDIGSLQALGRFDAGFLESLRDLRFGGDVDAVPEGTIMFPGEPLLRVRAPLREAQLVESRVINLLQFQTMIASKAVRSVLAARGKQLVDFGMRRAHGAEAALLSARASYLAGFDGSATVAAGVRFGIPLFGTMAHSFVQAHQNEAEAFAAYARTFPGRTTLLIDTYDVQAAARLVARLAGQDGLRFEGVRIDSGDLADYAREVRAILDGAGCREIAIFASSNLDEYQVQALEQARAPIQGYGIGTRMNTSADAPFLDCAYKLVDYAGRPVSKLSTGKATWPGAKQVFRRDGLRGEIATDCLALEGEQDAGTPLLVPVMRAGRPLAAPEPLATLRERVRLQLERLPAPLRALAPAQPYPVTISPELQALGQQVEVRQRLMHA